MLTDSGGAGVTPEMIAAQQATRPANLVPPAMAVLAHESCRMNGEIFSVGGGTVSRYFLSETRGWNGGAELTPEDVLAHLDEVLEPADARAWKNVHESVQERIAALSR
jgi:hypothetical protein